MALVVRWRGLRAGKALALVLALTVASACFQRHRAGQDTPPTAEVALSVTNHHWLDVVIYVIHDGQRTRVGTVTASSVQTFTLPPWMIGQGREIRLVGHPIGGVQVAQTETLTVQPGQYIEWTLENDLRRSSVGVF